MALIGMISPMIVWGTPIGLDHCLGGRQGIDAEIILKPVQDKVREDRAERYLIY